MGDWRIRKNNKEKEEKPSIKKKKNTKVVIDIKKEEKKDYLIKEIKKKTKEVAEIKGVSIKPKIEQKLDINSTSGKKQTNPNSLANLIPGANKNGRPKGKLNFDTRVDMAIEVLARKYVQDFNSKKENKNKQIKLDDVDIEGDIFAQFLNKARNGNERMIDSFLDRRHGKATSRIELTGKDGDPIAYEERKREAKSKARRMLDLWVGK